MSLDDTCCDLSDFGANGYDTGVRLLTQQARQLNPALRVKGVPWSAPGWMKDNGRMDQMGWLKWEYYPLYAQYFVRYVQSYAAAGVRLDYVSVQNEPNCCQAGNPTAMNYPGMSWNSSGLAEFTKNHLYPAFRAAGITTKVLIHDWNYGDWAGMGAGVLADAAVRDDPLFGGIAWHGYFGDPAVGSQVHGQYPNVPQFSTEHSGGTWIANQHDEDLRDIVTYARNWSGSLVKWSLALNQNMGPHNGGCGTCTGLITVQEGGARAGQVDYTIEYYTTGHLTKFVAPGAERIASTASSRGAQRRVAQHRRPQGAHRPQPRRRHAVGAGELGRAVVHVRAAGAHHGDVRLVRHARPGRRDRRDGGRGHRRRRQVPGRRRRRQRRRHRRPALDVQRLGARSSGPAARTAPCARSGSASTSPAAPPPTVPSCSSGRATAPAPQQWTANAARDVVNPASGRCLDVNGTADGARAQIWSCHGGANQKWTVP